MNRRALRRPSVLLLALAAMAAPACQLVSGLSAIDDPSDGGGSADGPAADSPDITDPAADGASTSRDDGARSSKDGGATNDANDDARDASDDAGDASDDAEDASDEAEDASDEAGNASDASADASDASADASDASADAGDASDASADASDAGPKQAFETPTTFKGAFDPPGLVGPGGLAAADARCMEAAQATFPGRTFVAWLATAGTSAPARLGGGGPWYVGAVYLGSLAQLTAGNLQTALDKAPDGTAVPAPLGVWTGTEANGTAAIDRCNDWTSSAAAASGQIGTGGGGGDTWTYAATRTCSSAYHLYCFEK
jgi:hypothetical protein